MSDLEKLLKLYHPNVPEGNYLGDAGHRGGNQMLTRAIVALGLATADDVAAHFAALDAAAYERSERRLAAINAERNP